MPKPRQGAGRVMNVVDGLREFESGSFVDIRPIDGPEEYAALMEARNKPENRF